MIDLETAKFRSSFKTRNGLTAIYLWKNSKNEHSVIVEGQKKPFHYNSSGIFYSQIDKENDFDLVEEIDIIKEVSEWLLENLPRTNPYCSVRYEADLNKENFVNEFVEHFKSKK